MPKTPVEVSSPGHFPNKHFRRIPFPVPTCNNSLPCNALSKPSFTHTLENGTCKIFQMNLSGDQHSRSQGHPCRRRDLGTWGSPALPAQGNFAKLTATRSRDRTGTGTRASPEEGSAQPSKLVADQICTSEPKDTPSGKEYA